MDLITTITASIKDHSVIKLAARGHSSSSVLPTSFNELFCHALNLREQGKATHFAMCHSDIIAAPGWLDVLYGEMWSLGLDAISAVVPIKGPTGRTSTAIGAVADRWRVHRCVNIADRDATPPTFTTKDVCGDGELLLINTGLMLLDLRRPWWDDFAFQFHSRINRKTNDDGTVHHSCESRSEDWEMSHHLHAAGARYGATWRVKLKHEGLNRWPNHPEPAPQPMMGLPYWQSVEGWLTPDEGAALQRLAMDKTCLELGSHKGRSTCCLAEVASHVDAVDWFRGDARVGSANVIDAFRANVAKAPKTARVVVVPGRFDEVLPGLESARYDLVFVDDAHDAGTVATVRHATRLVKPGGVIAFHDWPIVAVQEAAATVGLAPEGVAGSLAWCRVPEGPS